MQESDISFGFKYSLNDHLSCLEILAEFLSGQLFHYYKFSSDLYKLLETQLDLADTTVPASEAISLH